MIVGIPVYWTYDATFDMHCKAAQSPCRFDEINCQLVGWWSFTLFLEINRMNGLLPFVYYSLGPTHATYNDVLWTLSLFLSFHIKHVNAYYWHDLRQTHKRHFSSCTFLFVQCPCTYSLHIIDMISDNFEKWLKCSQFDVTDNLFKQQNLSSFNFI